MRPRSLLERPSVESAASAWLEASLVAGDPKMASVHALWAELRCLASFAAGLDNEGETKVHVPYIYDALMSL